MDALTSILLYACAAVAVAGALGAAIAPPEVRSLCLIALTAGTAGLLAVLSAGYAAVAWLVVGVAAAALLGRPSPASAGEAVWLLRQLGGVVAAALFAVLAYAAFKGSFGHGAYPGGGFGSAAVGRLLIDRDALAGVAAGGLLLAGVIGAAAAWRPRRR